MNKLHKIALILKTIFRQPYQLNKVLDDSGIWKIMADKKGFRQGLPVLPYSSIVDNLEATIDPYLFLDGGSLPTDLALLRHLATKFSPCRYFEIGTWRGESAANVAQIASECFTLNLSAEEMKQHGCSEDAASQVGMLSRNYPNIKHLVGNSLHFDFEQFDKPFDLIFIDGDHHYAQVKNDTEKVYKHLTHPGSIIVWHDYAVHPEAVRFEVLAGILDGLPQNEYSNLFHVSHTKVAVLMRDMHSIEYIDPSRKPEGVFSLGMKYRPL